MEYRVPIYVTVTDGVITRVRVDDEAPLEGGVLWAQNGETRVLDKRTITKIETVMSDAEWPAWEIGP
jgi:hypothetical protein